MLSEGSDPANPPKQTFELNLFKKKLPDMQEMLDKLRGATKVFSSLDMQSAFNQLVLHEESRDLTVFMTHDGLWRYKRCCFGLSSIPAAFQKVMEAVLKGLPEVMVYMDDILSLAEMLLNMTSGYGRCCRA